MGCLVFIIKTLALLIAVSVLSTWFPKMGEYFVIGFIIGVITFFWKWFFKPGDDEDHGFHYTDDDWLSNFRAKADYEQKLDFRKASEKNDETMFGIFRDGKGNRL